MRRRRGEVLGGGHGHVVDVAQPGRRHEDEQGPVERTGALHLGEGEVDPFLRRRRAVQPTNTWTGAATAGAPMTVSMERSGTPRRSLGQRSRTHVVTMWRRPSLPSVAHGTRLSGPPLRVGPSQRVATSSPSTGSSAAAPASIERIARVQTSDVPPTSAPSDVACVAARQTSGPPGSTVASRRPAAPAMRCST